MGTAKNDSGVFWEWVYRFRVYIIIALHMAATVTAYFGAFYIRFDFDISEADFRLLYWTLPYLIIARAASYLYYGTFFASLRFSGIKDLWDLLKAQVIGTVIFITLMFFLRYTDGFSRSVFLLEFLLSVLILNGIRFLRKFLIEFRVIDLDMPKKHVLIVGGGAAGVIILNEIKQKERLGISVIGFVDDDPYKKNTYIQGVPVLGNSQALPNLIPKYRIDEVVVAIPSAPYKDIMRIARVVSDANISVKVLPGLDKLIEGGQYLGQLNDIPIDQLIGRKVVKFSRETDRKQIEGELKDKVIMITGAGGSIGSEICMQVMEYGPRTLIAYERHENSLFEIELEIRKEFPRRHFVPVVGDIRDSAKLAKILREHPVDLIYHAAAYKHVPMMEREVVEAAKNNIFGTLALVENAIRNNIAKFILISTDKAVNPTSIMGTTKRIAELILQAYNGSTTKLISVRFGNVLESNGSVIPLFRKQIAKGEAVTVTHKDVSRYFMSIPEAVQLVLTAGAMGEGGEIFLLDMGEPVKILTLAKKLIRQAGLEPDRDIEIVFTGLRNGEKLHEELYWVGEGIIPTTNKKIMMLKPNGGMDRAAFSDKLMALRELTELDDRSGVIVFLKEIVPEAEIVSREIPGYA